MGYPLCVGMEKVKTVCLSPSMNCKIALTSGVVNSLPIVMMAPIMELDVLPNFGEASAISKIQMTLMVK